VGGTYVNGVQRQKPEIVAPQGVNTTVNLGPDYPSSDLDGYSNFFGTSASAPHAAAVAALIMEGRDKYLKTPNTVTPIATSPAQIRSILMLTATDMYPTVSPGFDLISGAGFINADAALRTFATPDPSLIKLVIPSTATPGAEPFTLSVTGVNISPSSVIKFRDSTLATTFINSVSATAVVPAFNGDPTISVYTPPISVSGSDGGTSDSLKFFNLPKKNITIIADNKNKKFAQELPMLTATILVDDDTLKNTTLTLSDLGLGDLTVSTLANAQSSVGTYTITPSKIFDVKNPVDVGLKELYNYTFKTGSLTIDKLPLTVTANNATITYGQKIPDIQFSYDFDPKDITDATGFLSIIETEHQNQLAKDEQLNDVLGLVNGKAVTIVNGKAVPIVNGVDEAAIVNGKAVAIVNGKAVPIVNGKAVTIVNGKAVTIVNNLMEAETQNLSFLVTTPALQKAREITNKTNGDVTGKTKVVDITQESITDFNDNSAQTYVLTSVSDVSPKGLIDIESIANGKAVTIVNGDETTEIVNGKAVTIVNGKAVTIVNGKAVTIVNGEAVTIVNGKAVTIVNGKAVPIVNNQGKTAVILDESEIGQAPSPLKSLNMLTGLDAGNQFIIPGTYQNDNFEITHKVGVLTVLPATVTISPATGISKVYGTVDPIFTYSNNTGLLPDEFTGILSRAGGDEVGSYAYTLGSLSAGENYSLSLSTAHPYSTFIITPKAIVVTPDGNQSKLYGSTDPAFTYSVNELILPGNNFSGALGRVPGETVAGSPYTFTPGNLSAGNNYTITLAGSNTFVITAKTITVTPNTGQSKVYGSNDPVFTFTNDGGLSSNQFTGTLARASGNNVGNYNFFIGSLAANQNYVLTLAPINTFAITPAALQVVADDKYIFKGDPKPSFTAVVTGKKYMDNPAVTYSTNYVQGSAPGKYWIKPTVADANYISTVTNGNLYVNPKGPGVDDVDIYLDCVEDRGNTYLPANRRYIAHFYVKNANCVPVYVPIGPDNRVVSSGSFDASLQPTVFLPGIRKTTFDVPFDGTYLKWELRTYECYTKVLETAIASSSSKKCTIYAANTRTASTLYPAALELAVEVAPEVAPETKATVFPNPVRNKTTIKISDEIINGKELVLFDAAGRAYPVKITRNGKHTVEIDMSGLASGMYFTQLKIRDGFKSVSIVKE